MILINKNKVISAILMLMCIFFSLYFFAIISNADSDSALSQGKDVWKKQSCVCSEKYSAMTPVRSGEKITSQENRYKYSDSDPDDDYCTYQNENDSSDYANVPCGGLTSGTLMQKYINAGLLEVGDAENFVREASTYAAYVQEGLSTKTQKFNDTTNRYEMINLGNGPFNRAMFEFNQNAHFVYSFMIGFAFVTSLLVFILIFIKITWLPDYPMQRRLAMEDIVTSGVATVLLGGIWLVVSLFQSIFDKFWSTYAIYSKDWRTVGNMFLYEYKGLITGILGIAALTALLMFVKNFASLSFSGDNPSARKQKMLSILLCGIATAGLGALTIFAGFFWNILN